MKVKIEAPDSLSPEERWRIWHWVKVEYPIYSDCWKLRQMWNRCRTWHKARGNQFVDWAAAFEGWIVIQYERDHGEPHGLRGAALSRHVEAVAKRRRQELEVIAGGRK